MINVKLLPETAEKITAASFDEQDGYLGAGVSAKVYRGTVVHKNGTQAKGGYVFKIPHSHAHDAKMQEEFDILSEIAKQSRRISQKVFTPEPLLGHHPDGDYLILIMPFYQNRLQDAVRKLLIEQQFIAAEKLAVQAMIDFSYATQALHNDGNGSTSPDRKLKDFYLGENNQLVVIDWNVQRPYTAKDLSAEMGIIGQLYHELFLGSKGNNLYVPLNDNEWQVVGDEQKVVGGVVSIGLRYILAHMVDTDNQYKDKGNGFPSAERLRQSLTVWLDALNDPAQLTNLSSPPNDSLFMTLTQVEKEAIRADLEWRQGGALPSGDLFTERQQSIASIFDQRSKTVKTVANIIMSDSYEAKRIIDSYQVQDGDYKEWGHLQRWRLFADIPISGDRYIRSVIEELYGIWNSLVRPFEADTNPQMLYAMYQSVSAILGNELPDKEMQALKIIQAETKLRQLVAEYKGEREQLPLEERRKKLSTIQSLIPLPSYILPAQAPQKGATLLGSVLDVEQELIEVEAELTAKTNVETQLGELIRYLEANDLGAATEYLTAQLSNYKAKTYPDLKNRAPLYEAIIDFAEQISRIPAPAESPTKYSRHLMRYAEDLLSRIKNEPPDFQDRLQRLIRTLRANHLVRLAQMMQHYLETPTWNDYYLVGSYYRIITSITDAEVSASLPHEAYASITKATERYTKVGEFYKHWSLYVLNPSPPEFEKIPTQDAFERNVKKFAHERIAELSNLIEDARKLNISIDEILEAIKKGHRDGQNITLEKILIEGFSAIINHQTTQEAEAIVTHVKKMLADTAKDKASAYEVSMRNLNKTSDEYLEQRGKLDGYLDELHERDSEVQNKLSGLGEQLAGLTTGANKSNEELQTRIESLSRYQANLNSFFEKITLLHNLEAKFRSHDINAVTQLLEALDDYCADNANNPHAIGIVLIEQQIVYWYNLVKEYKHLQYLLEHHDSILKDIQKRTKNPKDLFEFYSGHLRQLEDFMYTSDDLIFSLWQNEWENCVKSLMENLITLDSKHSKEIKSHIGNLIANSKMVIQRKKEQGN